MYSATRALLSLMRATANNFLRNAKQLRFVQVMIAPNHDDDVNDL